jgi:hypothetical protein
MKEEYKINQKKTNKYKETIEKINRFIRINICDLSK